MRAASAGQLGLVYRQGHCSSHPETHVLGPAWPLNHFVTVDKPHPFSKLQLPHI